MALVQDGYELTVNLADTSGSISTLRYELRAADQLTAQTDAIAITAALAAITESVISEYRINEIYREDAFALPAAAENAIKASISAYLSGLGNRRANIKIPAPVDAIFTSGTGPGYNVVNGGFGTVQAYLDLFEATGGVADISDGETLRDGNPFGGGKRISRGSQNP